MADQSHRLTETSGNFEKVQQPSRHIYTKQMLKIWEKDTQNEKEMDRYCFSFGLVVLCCLFFIVNV